MSERSTEQTAERQKATEARRDAHVLFYDGECGLCSRSIEMIKRQGPREPIVYVDVTDDEAMKQYPQIDRSKSLERVTLLQPDGAQLRAYDAVAGVLDLLPGWRRLTFALRWWPIVLGGHAAYHLVSPNRHRISRALGMK